MDYEIASNRRKVEAVDLQPYGNTISVETTSDNPFEDAQDVEVFTQANSGFGGPAPKSMKSKRIITKPQHVSPMWAGRVTAVKMRAPAHRPHTGFAPGVNGLGLGAEPEVYGPPSPPPAPNTTFNTVAQGITSLAQTAGQVAAQALQVRQQKAMADQAAAQARAAEADARRQSMLAPIQAMSDHKAISGTALVVGAVAIGAALFFFMKRK